MYVFVCMNIQYVTLSSGKTMHLYCYIVNLQIKMNTFFIESKDYKGDLIDHLFKILRYFHGYFLWCTTFTSEKHDNHDYFKINIWNKILAFLNQKVFRCHHVNNILFWDYFFLLSGALVNSHKPTSPHTAWLHFKIFYEVIFLSLVLCWIQRRCFKLTQLFLLYTF